MAKIHGRVDNADGLGWRIVRAFRRVWRVWGIWRTLGYDGVLPGALQPLCKLGRIGVHTPASAARHTMHRQPALTFPALDGAFVPPKERTNFFP